MSKWVVWDAHERERDMKRGQKWQWNGSRTVTPKVLHTRRKFNKSASRGHKRRRRSIWNTSSLKCAGGGLSVRQRETDRVREREREREKGGARTRRTRREKASLCVRKRERGRARNNIFWCEGDLRALTKAVGFGSTCCLHRDRTKLSGQSDLYRVCWRESQWRRAQVKSIRPRQVSVRWRLRSVLDNRRRRRLGKDI